MTWLYRQTTGDLFMPDGTLLGRGYSGAAGITRNNPLLEEVANAGVIPAGRWRLVGVPYDGEHTGPFTLALEPVNHDAHGRTAFRIHGSGPDGNSSRGCICISPELLRRRIWAVATATGDAEIVVQP